MKRLLITLCTLLLASCSGEAPKNLNIGDAAPRFKTVQLDGVPVDFPSGYAGKPVVLRFWADWCKFCEPEMKLIDTMRQRYPALTVLAVNAGQDRATIEDFALHQKENLDDLIAEN